MRRLKLLSTLPSLFSTAEIGTNQLLLHQRECRKLGLQVAEVKVRADNTVSAARDKNDRRASDRFPIEREVRYKILSKKHEELGTGSTVNMSSNGVLFTTDQLMIPGRRLELNISWPAQLNSKIALKLVARGRIVRYEDGRAAMEIQQYEFRTQGSGASLLKLQ